MINSLHFAFINLHGRPLNIAQVMAVWRAMKELRSKPFLSFDQAIVSVGDLESVQFEVDPPILSELFDDPDDE